MTINTKAYPDLTDAESRTRMINDIVEGGDRTETRAELQALGDSALYVVWLRA